MSHLKELEFSFENIETSIDLPLAILKIKNDGFMNFANLQANNRIFDWYKQVNKTEEIKTVLLMGEPGVFSEKNYQNFLAQICDTCTDDMEPEQVLKKINSTERSIEINMIANYANEMINMDKLIIIAMQGEVVTPFFGMALLADLRFASENMSYVLAHKKFGIHPSGLLPFLLPKYIGLGQAMKYLMVESRIEADKAYDLGINTTLFEEKNFMENCIAEAKKISTHNQNVITTTKKLLYNFNKELDAYITKEQQYKHR